MAMTRKYLAAMGIEPEKIDEIISAHVETVEALKSQIEEYRASADKLPAVQQELDSLKAQAKENAKYKEKYEKEHEAFEGYKTEQAEKETTAKKTAAYRSLLKEAGITDKHLATVLKASDLSTIEFDEEGKVADPKKVVKAIKDEWGDIIPVTRTEGANTGNPPDGDGGSKYHGTGRAAQLAKQYHDNLYGVSKSEGGNE